MAHLPTDPKAWRKSLRLTQERAALAVGVDRRTWQRWELEPDLYQPKRTERLAMLALSDHPDLAAAEKAPE